MRVGFPGRPHLVQHDRHAGPRELPGGLAPGQAAADDMHRCDRGFVRHSYGARMLTSAPRIAQARPLRTDTRSKWISTAFVVCSRGSGPAASGGIYPAVLRFSSAVALRRYGWRNCTVELERMRVEGGKRG